MPRPNGVAFGIMDEGLLVLARILERLAEREMKLQPIVIAQ